MRRSAKQNRKDPGFTLLEICIAVAIIAVLAALAATSLSAAQRNGRISGEARHMLGLMQVARAQAVSTSVCHGVLIGGHTETGNGGRFKDRVISFREVNAPGAACRDYIDGTDRVLSNDLTGESGDLDGDGKRASHYTWSPLEATPNFDYTVVFDRDTGRPTVYSGGAVVAPAGAPLRYDLMLRDVNSDLVAGNPTGNPSRRRVQITPTGMAEVSICPTGANLTPCAP